MGFGWQDGEARELEEDGGRGYPTRDMQQAITFRAIDRQSGVHAIRRKEEGVWRGLGEKG